MGSVRGVKGCCVVTAVSAPQHCVISPVVTASAAVVTAASAAASSAPAASAASADAVL